MESPWGSWSAYSVDDNSDSAPSVSAVITNISQLIRPSESEIVTPFTFQNVTSWQSLGLIGMFSLCKCVLQFWIGIQYLYLKLPFRRLRYWPKARNMTRWLMTLLVYSDVLRPLSVHDHNLCLSSDSGRHYAIMDLLTASGTSDRCSYATPLALRMVNF